jgi:hypothetical protein
VPHSSLREEWDLPHDFLPALDLGLIQFLGGGDYHLKE